MESHVFQLANELTAAGASVVVVCLAPEPSDSEESGVRVVRLRMHLPIASVLSFPALGTTRRLAQFLKSERIDAVSTHTRFFPMSYVGMKVARRLGVPLIHTEHGAGFVQSPSPVIRLGSRIVDLTMGRVILKRATAVLAVSQPVAKFVFDLAKVPSVIFYNALQMENWPNAGSPQRPRSIVFLGRLVPGKGWETFVDVAASLIREWGHPELSVRILGDGPDAAAVKARVADAGIADSTHLHGYADVGVIRESLKDSVFVNPSELAEGFQITLLEAAAAGAQIVSYPVPSVEPLREDGAPVWEVTRRTLPDLIASVDEALRDPRPAMLHEVLEQRWSWKARATEYLAIVRSAMPSLDTDTDPVGRNK
ncbi:glycosyltransferase family 4 protein [Leifsonia sp. YAF41]|uniref:glycosyltransferase family 4 protein n=1 Tax=Leifsonia sp. YAF41 TaxID=3233086 RepID=UPI003F974535